VVQIQLHSTALHPACLRQPPPGPLMSTLWPGLAEAVSTADCASVKPSSGGIVPRCVLQGWDAASLTTGLGATLGYHYGLLVQ